MFRITTNGVFTNLFTFAGTNGNDPVSGLRLGTNGLFYGTTQQGGSNNFGTVFKITGDGALTTLFCFNGTNGALPVAGLTLGSDGAFYGATAGGGTNAGRFDNGCGTVFKITADGTFTSLVSFDSTNGNQPIGTLALGSDGSFYGTTFGGGTTFNSTNDGLGTVFKVTTNGILTSLVSFNGTNGSLPQFGGLIQGSDGAFYGTTSGNFIPGQRGTVFKVTTNGMLTTLVTFTFNNGSDPRGGLVQASDGAFYGTTIGGGTNGGWGTVFKLTANGVFTTLIDFDSNDTSPQGGMIQGSDGTFYGTTGGLNAPDYAGTVFRLCVPSASSPLIMPANQAGNTFGLSWIPLPGRSYQLQCASNIYQTNWADLIGPITPTNGSASVSSLAATNGQGFYRVVLLP